MAASVAFICSGNICRSPMADVVTRRIAADRGLALRVESFGTGSWHEGEGMDRRARAALEGAGYVDHGHRARAISPERLAGFERIVVADHGHRRALESFHGGAFANRVTLLRSFDAGADGLELADPYYGGPADFAACLVQIEAAVPGLLDALTR